MFKHILLATDGSPASARAAQLAVALAREHGARLTALFVVDPYPYLGVGEASAVGVQAYMSGAYAQAAHAHAEVAQLCAAGAPVDLQPSRCENASAAAAIVEAAQRDGASVIVVGTHGRTGFKRLMLGSVAGKVVAQSPVPVLVVPSEAA